MRAMLIILLFMIFFVSQANYSNNSIGNNNMNNEKNNSDILNNLINEGFFDEEDEGVDDAFSRDIEQFFQNDNKNREMILVHAK
jgi:hypothetical protein